MSTLKDLHRRRLAHILILASVAIIILASIAYWIMQPDSTYADIFQRFIRGIGIIGVVAGVYILIRLGKL